MDQTNENELLTYCRVLKLLMQHGGYFHGPRATHVGITEAGFWKFVNDLLGVDLPNCK